MKLEQKKALGQVIRETRESRNWSQERLAGKSGVNLRTIQRGEGGYGIGSESVAALAEAFGLDERELKARAADANPPPPDKRIALKRLSTSDELLESLEQCIARGWTLETGLLDEHRYNEMLGEDVQILAHELENPARFEVDRIGRTRSAQAIMSFSRKMGFWLFAGNYTEEMQGTKRRRFRRGTLVVAAPMRDPRIVKTAKGPVLDLVRDSRRLLMGSVLADHCTIYDWAEDQLMAKSDGEFRVKDVIRRIMREVMEEMNHAEEQKRKKKR